MPLSFKIRKEVKQMKFKDLHFESDKREESVLKTDGFLKSCVNSVLCYGSERYLYDAHKESADRARKILRKAEDTEQFIDLFLEDDYFANTQAYAAMICKERPERRWMAIRKMFGERQFKTESDAGSLKVGNESFQTLIGNGRGDGVTRVAVFGKDEEFNREYFGGIVSTVQGMFNIYDYDCGDSAAKVVEGRYFVYAYDGFVALREFK